MFGIKMPWTIIRERKAARTEAKKVRQAEFDQKWKAAIARLNNSIATNQKNSRPIPYGCPETSQDSMPKSYQSRGGSFDRGGASGDLKSSTSSSDSSSLSRSSNCSSGSD